MASASLIQDATPLYLPSNLSSQIKGQQIDFSSIRYRISAFALLPTFDGFSFVDDAHHYVKTPLTIRTSVGDAFHPFYSLYSGIGNLYIDSGPLDSSGGH
jgi:hypothetical protein